MRFTICMTAAAAALCACTTQTETPSTPPPADNSADANMAAQAEAPAVFQLNETTWTFTNKEGKKVQDSIDASGNYVTLAVPDGKRLDQGTSVMKDGKACFKSTMTKEGEVCWTTKPVEIGQSMDTVSSKGEKLTVTRVDYVVPPQVK